MTREEYDWAKEMDGYDDLGCDDLKQIRHIGLSLISLCDEVRSLRMQNHYLQEKLSQHRKADSEMLSNFQESIGNSLDNLLKDEK